MSDNKKFTSKSAKERTSRIFTYIFLSMISIIWLIPFFYLICQAFRGESTHMVTYFFPKEWSLSNFRILFKETDFLSWYKNTLIIALFKAVLQTIMVLSVA